MDLATAIEQMQKDHAMLSVLTYRFHNQHRRGKHYRKLLEVRRALDCVEPARLPERMAHFAAVLNEQRRAR